MLALTSVPGRGYSMLPLASVPGRGYSMLPIASVPGRGYSMLPLTSVPGRVTPCSRWPVCWAWCAGHGELRVLGSQWARRG